MNVIRCTDAEEVAARSADAIATAVAAARTIRAVAHLCLTGGSTPRRCYQLLGPLLDSWEDVHLWFGDERGLPPVRTGGTCAGAGEGLQGAAVVGLRREVE